MRTTKILYPLDDSFSSTSKRKLKESWRNIQKTLNALKEGEDTTYDQLFSNLGIPEESYILAIRSSLNCPTIFLKRKPNELRVNNYNPACLSAWRANMDVQFILDVYACESCAMYIVSYISKAQKGMSELLRKACAEAEEGNSNIKQQVVFINTSPDERVQLLKPLSEIEEMPDESEEIHSGGMLKRYIERPSSLQNVTLADWEAWYDSYKKSYSKNIKKLDVDQLPLETADDDLCDDSEKETNKIKRRLKARIIRSPWFSRKSDREKHRELIMLFTPWRNEETDLMGKYSSDKEHYLALSDQIAE
ncbi:Hypothetical predicted protein [Paramuricea clavata]|uniref:Uncharacterized protein n=1 Tax=Paramuricea clavata TaxID=317549 RepID=A0A7D9HW79_PARCT|nr:Hypothetical predicted protein [Paramuricea clavata]